jgi:periplasmic iron binding protein
VRERWVGPIVVALILGGVIAVLVLNLNLKGRKAADRASHALVPSQTAKAPAAVVLQPAGFREYPIGEEVEKNEMVIKAVWLPPIQMEGMEEPTSSNLIHLEADIHATEGNRNGFAKGEFVPYLVVHYTIVPADAKAKSESSRTIQGKMMPMVARDGLHYGATIEKPAAGHYTLKYAIDPPSAGGLGRHVDAATGVEPWWKPFEVSFDWDFESNS